MALPLTPRRADPRAACAACTPTPARAARSARPARPAALPRAAGHVLLGAALALALQLLAAVVLRRGARGAALATALRSERVAVAPRGGDGGAGARDDAATAIAFFVQVAPHTVALAPRLVRRLHAPGTTVALHFDRKAAGAEVAAAVAAIRAYVGASDAVIILPADHITYRGISMTLNTVAAMAALLECGRRWDFFVNLSAADYPLLTPRRMHALLAPYRGLNFLSFASRRRWDDMGGGRMSQFWIDPALALRPNETSGAAPADIIESGFKNPIAGIRAFTVAYGEAWMVVSRSFCRTAVTGRQARKLLVAMAYSVSSPEHFFSTLAWNDRALRRTLVMDGLHLCVWHDVTDVRRRQHPHHVDVRRGGEASLENVRVAERDLKEVAASRGVGAADGGESDSRNASEHLAGYSFLSRLDNSHSFFARKFSQADSELMDFLDRRAQRDDTLRKMRGHVEQLIRGRESRLRDLEDWHPDADGSNH